MKSVALALLACVMISSPLSAGTVRAPRVSIASLDQLPQPLPLPYNEKANANRELAAAKARARKEKKLLLIDLGGNWCPDCRILAGLIDLPEIRSFVDRHYVVVTVDVGRFDRNQAIVRHYGIAKLTGVPTVLIVNPRNDRLLNKDNLFALTDARHMKPQDLADWLTRWL